MPQLDSFSISGEFEHHMEMEHNNPLPFELQTFSALDSISKKQEGVQPEWPADLNRAHNLIMANRVPSNLPPKVLGLPDIDVCQGKEPRYLNLTINPATQREMQAKEVEDHRQWMRDQAIREAQPKFRPSRRRSRSRRKSKFIPLTDFKVSSRSLVREDQDESKSFI